MQLDRLGGAERPDHLAANHDGAGVDVGYELGARFDRYRKAFDRNGTLHTAADDQLFVSRDVALDRDRRANLRR